MSLRLRLRLACCGAGPAPAPGERVTCDVASGSLVTSNACHLRAACALADTPAAPRPAKPTDAVAHLCAASKARALARSTPASGRARRRRCVIVRRRSC
jgi:hypothetical protein